MAIRCVGCVCASQKIFVYFGAKPIQRTADEISHKTGSRGGKEGLREDTEKQSTRESRRDQLALDSSPGEGWSAEEGSEERQLAFLVAFGEVSPKIHACNSLQMHRECRVSQNSLSCAWS